MREKGSKLLDVMVYSINYVLISYALSNVSMALKSSPVFILFCVHNPTKISKNAQ